MFSRKEIFAIIYVALGRNESDVIVDKDGKEKIIFCQF